MKNSKNKGKPVNTPSDAQRLESEGLNNKWLLSPDEPTTTGNANNITYTVEADDLLKNLDIFMDVFYKNKKVFEIKLIEAKEDEFGIDSLEKDFGNIFREVVKGFKGKKISNYQKDVSCKFRFELNEEVTEGLDTIYSAIEKRDEINNVDDLISKVYGITVEELQSIDKLGEGMCDKVKKCCGGKCKTSKELQKRAKKPGTLDILK